MTEDQAEIYEPLESTALSSIIPSEDKVFYSTMCNATYMSGYSVQGLQGVSQYTNFSSHLILTTGGVVYTKPKEGGVELVYDPWHEVTGLGEFVKTPQIEIRGITFILRRNIDLETEKEFKTRGEAFADKARPFVLKSKKEWYAINKDNPEIKVAKRAQAGHFIDRMEKAEKKRISLEEKRKKKEMKKK